MADKWLKWLSADRPVAHKKIASHYVWMPNSNWIQEWYPLPFGLELVICLCKSYRDDSRLAILDRQSSDTTLFCYATGDLYGSNSCHPEVDKMLELIDDRIIGGSSKPS